MSFNSMHENMAIIAISNSKTAKDFAFAAQKNADAAWLFAIVGGIIWYNFGWMWALIPFGFSIYSVIHSISSTKIAINIERLTGKTETRWP